MAGFWEPSELWGEMALIHRIYSLIITVPTPIVMLKTCPCSKFQKLLKSGDYFLKEKQ